MNTPLKLSSSVLTVILLAACNTTVQEPVQPEESRASSSVVADDVVAMETNNVTYTGTVQPAGISIYQQGSHRLVLQEGKFILLESDAVDLNGYVGEQVEIFGALRPTVEAGGMIMRVERIELIDQSSSKEGVVESSNASSEAMAATSSDKSSEESSSNAMAMSSAGSSESEVASQSPIAAVSPGFECRTEAMASQDFSDAQWTQEYCTGHIGFCVPVHRNWYYRSFGTTTSAFWHVEISSEPVEMLGDGPIVIKLLDGGSVATDRKVQTNTSTAIGYVNWSDDRHFEIRGDIQLAEAVGFITERLKEYEE